MPRSPDLCQATAGLMNLSVVRPTLLPTPSSDVGADTVPIPTNLKPGPLFHRPISSQTDAPLVALRYQCSDLVSNTP